MAEVVAKTGIKRESGFLYYLGKDGNVWRAKMKRGGNSGKGSSQKVADSHVKREAGYLYFIDKSGHVSRTPMSNRKKKK